MGFLNVSFTTDQGLDQLGAVLEKLPCFSVLGDWHDYRMRGVTDNGLSHLSAPAQSVVSDRNRNGQALHVQVMIANGDKLSGQIRKTNILVSKRGVTKDSLEADNSVRSLLGLLKQVANDIEVEIG